MGHAKSFVGLQLRCFVPLSHDLGTEETHRENHGDWFLTLPITATSCVFILISMGQWDREAFEPAKHGESCVP